jgi:hypothetical protein
MTRIDCRERTDRWARPAAVLLFAVAVASVGALPAAAHVNIEALRRDTLPSGFSATVGADFSARTGNVDLVQLGIVGRSDFIAGRTTVFLVGNTAIGLLSSTRFLSTGLLHLRQSYAVLPWLLPESFAQINCVPDVRLAGSRSAVVRATARVKPHGLADSIERMALIECPECGTVASTEATFCPQCGFPIKKLKERGAKEQGGAPFIPLTMLDVTKSIVGRLLFGGLVLASGIGFDAPPVIMLALVAWGSALPLYLKARRAHRLGPFAGHRQIEQAVVKQLTEARDETRRELAGIDVNASRIAELEERLDFMERLLARYREPA